MVREYSIPSVPSTVRRPQLQVASDARSFGPDPSKPASWVIREKGTGKVIMETFDQNLLQRLNTERYEAVPIQVYLGSLSGRV